MNFKKHFFNSPFIVTLAIFLILFVVGGTIVFLQKKEDFSKTTKPATSVNASICDTSSWKTYHNNKYNFIFTYPSCYTKAEKMDDLFINNEDGTELRVNARPQKPKTSLDIFIGRQVEEFYFFRPEGEMKVLIGESGPLLLEKRPASLSTIVYDYDSGTEVLISFYRKGHVPDIGVYESMFKKIVWSLNFKEQ